MILPPPAGCAASPKPDATPRDAFFFQEFPALASRVARESPFLPLQAACAQARTARISSRIARAPAIACARWLRRFFTSGGISAKVFPRDGISKIGS